MIIVGQGALAARGRRGGAGLARQGRRKFGMVRDGWNGFNVLHTAAARVGGLDLGFVPGEGGRDADGILDGAESGEIELSTCSAPTRSTSRARARPSSSIRATTAMPARIAPT